MKTKNIATLSTVLTALLLSTSSFAGTNLAETYPDPVVQSPAALTRAQVVQELVQAEAAGQLPLTEGNYNQVAVAPVTKTRAEVVAEARQARADGSLAVPSEVAMIPTATVATGNARSRAEVRAEAIQSAQANHSYAVRIN